MISFKQLKISLDYSHELDKHNHDLVVYVIKKYPRQVVKAAVLARNSADTWYENVKDLYPRRDYLIIVGTISLLGEILGLIQETEEDFTDLDEVDDKQKHYPKRPKDPMSN